MPAVSQGAKAWQSPPNVHKDVAEPEPFMLARHPDIATKNRALERDGYRARSSSARCADGSVGVRCVALAAPRRHPNCADITGLGLVGAVMGDRCGSEVGNCGEFESGLGRVRV